MEQLRNYELDRPILASEIFDLKKLHDEAWQLIADRQEIQHDNWELEPLVNARTAIFEELTAKGHLSRIESEEPIQSYNSKTLKRLVNGYSAHLHDEERKRRHLEIIEELVIHKVAAGIADGSLPPDTMVITISNIPAGISLEEARVVGYRKLNNKGMTRSTDFEGGTRVTEQISRSNSNDGSANRFLGSLGIVVGNDPTRILGTQIIATKKHFPDGVVDVQRALDNFAGPNIIYGEDRNQPDLNVPEYEDLRHVSFEREDQAEFLIQQLADYESRLNLKYKAGQMSYDEKLRKYSTKRKSIVDQICMYQPEYAKDARGSATVPFFEKAGQAMLAGDDVSGVANLELALGVADPNAGIVCGGSGVEASIKNVTQFAKSLFEKAKTESRFWKWKKGLCQIKECPSRPAKVDVGPCSVCRKCQYIFDKGKNPKSIYKFPGFLERLFKAA